MSANLIPPSNRYRVNGRISKHPAGAIPRPRRQSSIGLAGGSSYTEKLMAAGEWSVQLADNTPRSILERVLPSWFGYMVVTPTRMDASIGLATILSKARFSGIYRRRAPVALRTLTGASIAVLIGDEDQRGVIYEVGFDANQNFFDYVTSRVLGSGRGQGITAGTVGGAAAGTKDCRILFGSTPRQVLDYVCQIFKCEWRVNPDWTLDAGPATTIFNSTGRAAIVRKGGGYDLSTAGIISNIETTDSVEARSERVVCKADNGQLGTAWVDTFVEPTYPQYYAKNGNAVRFTIAVDSANAVNGVAAFDVAENQLLKVREEAHQIEVSTRQFEVGRWFGVGDTVGVFDPDRRVFDLTNPRQYRGQTIYPRKLRCLGRSTPISKRNGVYFVSFDSSGTETITALHPYVVTSEDDATVIELGKWRRKFRFPGRGRNLI